MRHDRRAGVGDLRVFGRRQRPPVEGVVLEEVVSRRELDVVRAQVVRPVQLAPGHGRRSQHLRVLLDGEGRVARERAGRLEVVRRELLVRVLVVS